LDIRTKLVNTELQRPTAATRTSQPAHAAGSTRRVPAGSTRRVPAGSTRRVPAGSTRGVPAGSTRGVPAGSTCCIPARSACCATGSAPTRSALARITIQSGRVVTGSTTREAKPSAYGEGAHKTKNRSRMHHSLQADSGQTYAGAEGISI
jgi:hypothetical protein